MGRLPRGACTRTRACRTSWDLRFTALRGPGPSRWRSPEGWRSSLKPRGRAAGLCASSGRKAPRRPSARAAEGRRGGTPFRRRRSCIRCFWPNAALPRSWPPPRRTARPCWTPLWGPPCGGRFPRCPGEGIRGFGAAAPSPPHRLRPRAMSWRGRLTRSPAWSPSWTAGPGRYAVASWSEAWRRRSGSWTAVAGSGSGRRRSSCRWSSGWSAGAGPWSWGTSTRASGGCARSGTRPARRSWR